MIMTPILQRWYVCIVELGVDDNDAYLEVVCVHCGAGC